MREVARARGFGQCAFRISIQFVGIKMSASVCVLSIAALPSAQSLTVAPSVATQQAIHLCAVRMLHRTSKGVAPIRRDCLKNALVPLCLRPQEQISSSFIKL